MGGKTPSHRSGLYACLGIESCSEPPKADPDFLFRCRKPVLEFFIRQKPTGTHIFFSFPHTNAKSCVQPGLILLPYTQESLLFFFSMKSHEDHLLKGSTVSTGESLFAGSVSGALARYVFFPLALAVFLAVLSNFQRCHGSSRHDQNPPPIAADAWDKDACFEVGGTAFAPRGRFGLVEGQCSGRDPLHSLWGIAVCVVFRARQGVLPDPERLQRGLAAAVPLALCWLGLRPCQHVGDVSV